MLSIIITHYKTPAILKICLKSLLQNLPQETENEIIIADSETIKETRDLISENFPDVIFLPSSRNLGYGKLVNAGLKKAKGDFILIINADIIIHKPDTLKKMIDYLKNNLDIGLLGPRLLNINGSHQPSAFNFYTPLTILARRTFFSKTPWGKKILKNFFMSEENIRNVGWLMGSALMTTRQAVEKVGFMDERFFMYFEDVDWSLRFWKNNYRVVYYPETEAYHYHMQASKKKGGLLDVFISKYTRTHIYSAFKYFQKHGLNNHDYLIK